MINYDSNGPVLTLSTICSTDKYLTYVQVPYFIFDGFDGKWRSLLYNNVNIAGENILAVSTVYSINF